VLLAVFLLTKKEKCSFITKR